MNRFEDVLSLACLEEKNQVGTVNVGRGQGRERERGEDKFGTVRGEKLRCETRMGRGSGVKREWVEVQHSQMLNHSRRVYGTSLITAKKLPKKNGKSAYMDRLYLIYSPFLSTRNLNNAVSSRECYWGRSEVKSSAPIIVETYTLKERGKKNPTDPRLDRP
ncbi:hypothetical protein RRG08_021601 [Elysia crispata]|uniref:Uncharacterized protein n=1 Tax=Elysia crispata TaxID=231223 RepID=A0AAE0XE83_9GAST|nr:hypothetical protein RRG08_021601 [Elysia crispata]